VPEIKKNKTYTIAYHIDETALRRLHDLLAKLGSNIRYEFVTKDNATLKYENLDDLLSFPNTVKHQIEKLTIDNAFHITVKEELAPLTEGQKPHTIETLKKIDTHGFIRFDTSRIQNVQLIVMGNDPKEVFYYFDEIEKKIEMMRRSRLYSFAAFLNLGLTISVVVAGYWLIYIFNHWPKTSIFDAPFQTLLLSCTVLLLPMTLYAIIYSIFLNLLDYLQNAIFPVATFAIGDGIKRDQRADFFRTAVLVSGIALPLLFLIVQSLLSR